MRHKLVRSDGTEITESSFSAFSHTSAVNSDTDLKIGSACSDAIEFSLWGSSDVGIGAPLEYYKVTDSGEEIKMGVFISEKPKQVSKNVYKVTAYDKMSVLESSCADWLERTAFPTGSETYTMLDFATMVVSQMGIELGDTSALLNKNFIVHPFYVDSGTFRLLIQWIAEAGGCFAHMDADGKLAFRWYAASSKQMAVSCDNGSLGMMAHTHDDYTVQSISSVRFTASEWVAAAGTGVNVYDITSNPLLEGSEQIAVQQVLENIKNRLSLLSYVPSESRIRDTTEIKAGDIVSVTDENGNSFSTLVMTMVCNAGRETRVSSTGNESRNSRTAVQSEQSKSYTRAEAQRAIVQQMAAVRADLEETIKGTKGGCKVDHYNDDGQIYETLYIDTMNESAAKNVLRINSAGISFSNKGVNGDFTQALSIDGSLMNEWINTWRLTADIVVAGILQSSDDGESFRLNLDTGEVHIKGVATDSDIQSAIKTNNESILARIESVDGRYVQLEQTLDGVTVTNEEGRTLINGGSIKTDNLQISRLFSQKGINSYVEMLENGLSFVLGNANAIGIGYYSADIPQPYILFGAGVAGGSPAGMIRQYENGIWIGNSVDRYSAEIVSGTGVFVDTENNIVYKYINGQPYVMADSNTVVATFG